MSIRANVDARRMDQRIAIQRKTSVSDGAGGFTVTWSNLASNVHAAVDGAKATPSEPNYGGIRSVSDYTVWIRADVFERLSLTTVDRVVWNGQNFDIVDMPNQQLRGRLIALIVRAGLKT
jgi:head-tail adaptor